MANTLQPLVATGILLDLSKATKLKDLMFWLRGSSVRWIVTALQTIESKKLQQITIYPLRMNNAITETIFREWEDLDRLLVQFASLQSIRTRVLYDLVDGRGDVRDRVLILLPELTRRGLADPVVYSS